MLPRPLPDDREVDAFIAAHRDGATREEVGKFLNCSRQRIEQIEQKALAKLVVVLKYRYTLDDLI